MRKLALLTATPIAAILLAGNIWAAAPTDKEVDEALTAFHKSYSSKEESDRLQAVETLGTIQSKRVVDALASPLQQDKIPAVRRAAAKALGGQWSLSAVPVLAKGLNTADPNAKDVNTAIITALGETNSDAAVPILVSLLQVKRQARSRGGDTPPPADPAEPPAYTQPALDALAKIASPKAMEDVMQFLGQQGAGSGR
jgi:HEAT repeat protein